MWDCRRASIGGRRTGEDRLRTLEGIRIVAGSGFLDDLWGGAVMCHSGWLNTPGHEFVNTQCRWMDLPTLQVNTERGNVLLPGTAEIGESLTALLRDVASAPLCGLPSLHRIGALGALTKLGQAPSLQVSFRGCAASAQETVPVLLGDRQIQRSPLPCPRSGIAGERPG